MRPIYLMRGMPSLLLAELIMFYTKTISDGFSLSVISFVWPFPGFSLVLMPFGFLILYFQFRKGMFNNFQISVTDEYIEGPKNYLPTAKSFISIENNKTIYTEFIIPNFLKFKFLKKPRKYYPRIQIAWNEIEYDLSYPQRQKFWPCLGQIISKKGDAIGVHYVFEKKQLKEMRTIINRHKNTSSR